MEQNKSDESADQKISFSYYSNKLNKKFDTLKELQEAEEAQAKIDAEKQKALAEKKADAKVVEDAYKALVETQVEAARLIKQKEDEYYKARQEFVDKYGSYHMTYSSEDGKVTLGVSDIVDSLLELFPFKW